MRTLRFSFVCICFLGNINVAFSQWGNYPTYDEYEYMMFSFQEDYPKLCKVEEFGTSVNGRKLLVAKITDSVDTIEKEPQFFYTSTIHGDDLVGYGLLLRLIDYLLFNYGSNERVTRLVDSIEIWINPLANPDGAYHGGNNTVIKAIKYNANNKDLDSDFPNPDSVSDPAFQPQPETSALMELFKREHFVMSADLKAGPEAAVYPWGHKSERTADEEWWRYVARQYADTAQKNGPDGYFTHLNNGIANQYNNMYQANGTFMDYVLYFHHCRNLTLSLSVQKILPDSLLTEYWQYNYKSLLNYIEQVLFGIRGIVTLGGSEPLEAEVFIENLDKDSSRVHSSLPFGDYYRPICRGIYDVTYSHPWYIGKTISNIEVKNGEATVVDVQLDITGIVVSEKNEKNDILINVCKNKLKIKCDFISTNDLRIEIFDISGKSVRKLEPETGIVKQAVVWNGFDNKGNALSNGCYIVRVENAGDILTKRFIFYK